MNSIQNIKMWCSNKLSAVGKWGGASFIFGVAITAFFMFGGNLSLLAYVSDVIPHINQSTELKLDLNPLDSVGQINEITLPVNDLINNAIKGLKFDQVVNIGTGIPLSPMKSPSHNIDFSNFSKFFSSSKVSSNDITSFLKEAMVTGINLTILIISITSQILKGLLSVLK